MSEDRAVALEGPGPPRHAEAPAVPEPQPFGPDDVVPRFRSDLHVLRGSTPALFDVADPAAGRKFTLYEFELAIARMLDGRRKVSEVVESGARLGIPMDVGALYKFVRQMWHYGFLAPPGAGAPEAGEDGTWGARAQWDEATRELFQSGKRLMRLGRNADAASYFEAVLDAHPANPEATEMLGVIARGQSLVAAPLGEVRPPAAPPPAAAPLAIAAAPQAEPQRRRRQVILFAGVALAIGALAVIALLVPPGGSERAAAPPPASPAAPLASSPAPAAAPAPAPAPQPAAAAAAVPRTVPVERRTHPPLAELVAPAQGDLAWTAPAEARVGKGQKVGELRVAVAAGRKDAALAKRVSELERLAAQDPVYRDFLEKARRDLRKAATRRKTRPVPLLAPAAGILARAPEATGSAAAGERLARVLDPATWLLAATVDGGEPAADARCEVVGDVPADRARCRLAARTRAGERIEVVAEVAEAEAPWIARAAGLWIRLGPGTASQTAEPPPAPAEGGAERRTP